MVARKDRVSRGDSAELHTKMAEADFYQQPGPVIAAEQERLSPA